MKRRASTNLDAFFERTLVSPKTCPAQVASSSASKPNPARRARAVPRVTALRLPAGGAVFPPLRPAFFPRDAARTDRTPLFAISATLSSRLRLHQRQPPPQHTTPPP